MCKGRVLIIGIDALDYNTLLSTMSNSHFFKKIAKEGLLMRMNSTIPPISPTAWASLATGVWPEKHRIYDFQIMRNGNPRVSSITTQLRGKCLWDYTSIAKLKTIVIGYPFTYPPYSINGIFVSGFPTPVNRIYGVPKNIENLLKELNYSPDVTIDYSIHNIKSINKIISKIITHIKKQFEVLLYLLDSNIKWDVFIYAIPTLDRLQHMMWYNDTFIRETYKLIDRYLYKIIRLCDVNIFIVSDHGFEKISYFVNIPSLIKFLNDIFIKYTGYKSLSFSINFKLMRLINILSPSLVDVIKRLYDHLPRTKSILSQSIFMPIGHNTICINRRIFKEFNDRILEFMSIIISKFDFIKNVIIDYDEGCIILAFKEGYDPEFSVQRLNQFYSNYTTKLKTGTHEGAIAQKNAVFAHLSKSPKITLNEKPDYIHIVDVVPTIMTSLGLTIDQLDLDGNALFSNDIKLNKEINARLKLSLKIRKLRSKFKK